VQRLREIPDDVVVVDTPEKAAAVVERMLAYARAAKEEEPVVFACDTEVAGEWRGDG
jgi:hypothetical protein